jgi:hypothetical protein
MPGISFATCPPCFESVPKRQGIHLGGRHSRHALLGAVQRS